MEPKEAAIVTLTDGRVFNCFAFPDQPVPEVWTLLWVEPGKGPTGIVVQAAETRILICNPRNPG